MLAEVHGSLKYQVKLRKEHLRQICHPPHPQTCQMLSTKQVYLMLPSHSINKNLPSFKIFHVFRYVIYASLSLSLYRLWFHSMLWLQA